MKKEDYNQLRRQVEGQYRQAIELAEKERIEGLAAIDVVWNMFHKPRRKYRRTVGLQQSLKPANDSPLPAPKRKYGVLIDTVKKSFAYVPETFTCKNVIMAMKQISNDTFNPSSVSNRLKRFAKEGVLEIINQGHGKSPSVYRLKNAQTVNDTKTEERKL